MKNVLIIANQFPPMGGPGVQRSAKFVKHLRAFGYEPVVLTRDELRLEIKDPSLLKDIPSDVKVYRTASFDFTTMPGYIKLFGKVLARKILIPDGDYLWQLFSRKKAVEIIKEHKIDLIYSTSYPYSDHLLGLYLKQKLGIPWVSDFRDEWTNNPYLKDNPHGRLRASLECSMEKSVLNDSDVLITNTPVMMSNFVDNNPDVKNIKQKFHFIPNGYDIEDFNAFAGSRESGDKCIVTYTGGLYGRRKPDSFFKAISELHKEGKVNPANLEITFIGNYYIDKMKSHISSFGISDYIKILPYMPHSECLKRLTESDILLLIEGEGVGANAFYTGKVFEYMMALKPVLALLPDGCAKDLVIETNIGLAVHVENIEEIKNAILKLYNDFLNDTLSVSPNMDEIKKYERKELTKSLAGLFDLALKKAQ